MNTGHMSICNPQNIFICFPFFLKHIPLFDFHIRIFIQVSPVLDSQSNTINFQEDKNYGKNTCQYGQAILNHDSAFYYHFCRENQYQWNSMDFLDSKIALKLGTLFYIVPIFFGRSTTYWGHINEFLVTHQSHRNYVVLYCR